MLLHHPVGTSQKTVDIVVVYKTGHGEGVAMHQHQAADAVAELGRRATARPRPLSPST